MSDPEYEAAVRETRMREEAEEFAKTFSDFVNVMCGEDRREAAIAYLMREHRTLQQNAMRFVMEFIEAMSQQSSDLRNHDSVALAKKILDMVPWDERILLRI